MLAIGIILAAAFSVLRSAAQAAVISRCAPAQLAAWVNADSADGTAGTTYYHLDITNTGGSTCYLYGYPGVSATSSTGKQLGVPAVRNPDVPAAYVHIAAGSTAHALLGYVDAALSPACHPVTAMFLQVYPPGATGVRHAYFPLAVCTSKTYDLTIGRVQPGT